MMTRDFPVDRQNALSDIDNILRKSTWLIRRGEQRAIAPAGATHFLKCDAPVTLGQGGGGVCVSKIVGVAPGVTVGPRPQAGAASDRMFDPSLPATGAGIVIVGLHVGVTLGEVVVGVNVGVEAVSNTIGA